MNQPSHVDLSAWGAKPPLWISLLAHEVQRSNRTQAARRIGMSRTAVTLALANRYPSPSTERFERRVLTKLGRLECPALAEMITVQQCQTYRERPAPTHNPYAMQHWKACQHCPHNPSCANRPEIAHARLH